MSEKVKVGIEANLDLSAAEQRLNELGREIARLNKVQYTPVKVGSAAELKKILDMYQQLLRVQGDMARKARGSGQADAGLLNTDFSRMYPNEAVRGRQMRSIWEYSVGAGSFGASVDERVPHRPPGGGGGGGAGSSDSWWDKSGKKIAVHTAQSGMRSLGPVGGVAANALGTGMASGAGAGLMGLVGGLAALGLGKAFGAIMERVDTAEGNNVQFDKLKRSLGDVNVSFAALKKGVNEAADSTRILYSDAIALSGQYVKAANMQAGQYKTLPEELRASVGLARDFGVEPSQTTGILGTMRGLGVTKDTQETKRFALLLGETIGRSGAFAKAEEVFSAIGGFAESQTRQNLSAANTSGYAGMLSGLVGSGITGMDVTGAAGMLARVNAAISSGGAFGEASQFFTGGIGASMGLNPYQTRMLREGGAFATTGDMFGPGSVYARYKGKPLEGASGSTTMLQATLDKLRSQYGAGSDELAEATANHLGIGINQAMALLSVKPNQMGTLGKYTNDLKSMTGTGIGNMTKALFGTDEDRKALATSLKGTKGITDEDRKSIDAVMAGNDVEAQKDTLAKMSGKYGQESTLGSDVRDGKALLDNIKTSMADKLVPYTSDIRQGILYMAGVKDGKSPKDILAEVMREEGKDKARAIDVNYQNSLKDNNLALAGVRKEKLELLKNNTPLVKSGQMTLEEHAKQMQPLLDREKKLLEQDNQIREDHAKALKENTKKVEEEIEKMRAEGVPAATPTPDAGPATTGALPGVAPASYAPGGGGGGSASPVAPGGARAGAAPDAGDESQGAMTRGYRNNNPGNLEATVPWAGMVGNDGRFAKFDSPESGYRAMGRNLLAYRDLHGLSTIRGIINRWAPSKEKKNNTAGYIERVSKELGIGPDEQLDMQDPTTLGRLMRAMSRVENGYVRHGQDTIEQGAAAAISGKYGTPLPQAKNGATAPAGARPGDGQMNGGQMPPLSGEMSLKLELSPAAARILQPSAGQSMSGRVGAAAPFGVA